jgi:group I intron endonuclease
MYKISEINKFPKTNGIYKIYFLDCKSKKIYVGSASSKDGFYGRWKSHSSQLIKNKSGCNALQNAFNKYFTNDNLIFEIIEECDVKDCLIKEQCYIDNLNSYNNGYNTRPNASNNGGLKMKESSKELIYKTWKKERDKLSPDVTKLYNSGKTTREICNLLNISRNFLKRIFVENNIIPRSDRGIKKRKVYQYKNNKLINEFESINKCSRELELNIHGIDLVLKGTCIHYKGFYFSFNKLNTDEIYKISNNFKIKSKNVKYKNIKQISIVDDVIKKWNNVNEIMEYFGIKNKNGIYKAINNKILYRGFYWIIK